MNITKRLSIKVKVISEAKIHVFEEAVNSFIKSHDYNHISKITYTTSVVNVNHDDWIIHNAYIEYKD